MISIFLYNYINHIVVQYYNLNSRFFLYLFFFLIVIYIFNSKSLNNNQYYLCYNFTLIYYIIIKIRNKN